MYLKGKNNVITDALSQISPLEPESADKDDFDAIPVHQVTFEIPTTESWLERIRVVMQAYPILSQLKYQIFQGWPDAKEAFQKASTHSGTTGMSYQ